MTRQSVKQMAHSVAEHPATAWVLYVLGIPMLGISLYLIVVERDADKFHTIVHSVVGIVGLGMMPVVRDTLIASARGAIGIYRTWKNGGGPPTPPAPLAPVG